MFSVTHLLTVPSLNNVSPHYHISVRAGVISHFTHILHNRGDSPGPLSTALCLLTEVVSLFQLYTICVAPSVGFTHNSP